MLKITQIINEIETRLSHIRTANGYHTNIGTDIRRDWISRIINSEHRAPFIVIQHGSSDLSGYSGTGYVARQELNLIAVVDDIADQCSGVMHDLRRALLAGDRTNTFGGLATKVEQLRAEPTFENDRVYLSLTLSVQYSEAIK